MGVSNALVKPEKVFGFLRNFRAAGRDETGGEDEGVGGNDEGEGDGDREGDDEREGDDDGEDDGEGERPVNENENLVEGSASGMEVLVRVERRVLAAGVAGAAGAVAASETASSGGVGGKATWAWTRAFTRVTAAARASFAASVRLCMNGWK